MEPIINSSFRYNVEIFCGHEADDGHCGRDSMERARWSDENCRGCEHAVYNHIYTCSIRTKVAKIEDDVCFTTVKWLPFSPNDDKNKK